MAFVSGERKRIWVTNLASYCIGEEFTLFFFFFLLIQENIWKDAVVQKREKGKETVTGHPTTRADLEIGQIS